MEDRRKIKRGLGILPYGNSTTQAIGKCGGFACVMTQAVLAKFAKFVLGTPKRCAMDKGYILVLFEKTNYNNMRRDGYGLYDIKRS